MDISKYFSKVYHVFRKERKYKVGQIVILGGLFTSLSYAKITKVRKDLFPYYLETIELGVPISVLETEILRVVSLEELAVLRLNNKISAKEYANATKATER